MMTTAPSRLRPAAGPRVLRTAALVSVVAGLLVTVAGALVAGAPAAYGALAGALLVVGVLGSGSAVVGTVAGRMPAASLLVALLTYTLQVVLMGVALLVLERSGLSGDALDRGWLAGVVIAGTLGWVVVQVVLTTRQRIPAYDLTEAGAP